MEVEMETITEIANKSTTLHYSNISILSLILLLPYVHQYNTLQLDNYSRFLKKLNQLIHDAKPGQLIYKQRNTSVIRLMTRFHADQNYWQTYCPNLFLLSFLIDETDIKQQRNIFMKNSRFKVLQKQFHHILNMSEKDLERDGVNSNLPNIINYLKNMKQKYYNAIRLFNDHNQYHFPSSRNQSHIGYFTNETDITFINSWIPLDYYKTIHGWADNKTVALSFDVMRKKQIHEGCIDENLKWYNNETFPQVNALITLHLKLNKKQDKFIPCGLRDQPFLFWPHFNPIETMFVDFANFVSSSKITKQPKTVATEISKNKNINSSSTTSKPLQNPPITKHSKSKQPISSIDTTTTNSTIKKTKSKTKTKILEKTRPNVNQQHEEKIKEKILPQETTSSTDKTFQSTNITKKRPIEEKNDEEEYIKKSKINLPNISDIDTNDESKSKQIINDDNENVNDDKIYNDTFENKTYWHMNRLAKYLKLSHNYIRKIDHYRQYGECTRFSEIKSKVIIGSYDPNIFKHDTFVADKNCIKYMLAKYSNETFSQFNEKNIDCRVDTMVKLHHLKYNENLTFPTRIICLNGNFWFHAADSCKFLKYSNTNDAIKRHVSFEHKKFLSEFGRVVLPDPTKLNRNPQTLYISEEGLNQLILKSKMPLAKQICNWLATNVMPSIRKTGKYEYKDNNNIIVEEKDLQVALLQKDLKISQLEKELQLQIFQLEKESQMQISQLNLKVRETEHQLMLKQQQLKFEKIKRHIAKIQCNASRKRSIVELKDSSKHETFGILFSDKLMEFKFLRSQYAIYQREYKNFILKNDSFQQVKCFNNVPNAMRILLVLKEKLNIRTFSLDYKNNSGTHFKLLDINEIKGKYKNYQNILSIRPKNKTRYSYTKLKLIEEIVENIKKYLKEKNDDFQSLIVTFDDIINILYESKCMYNKIKLNKLQNNPNNSILLYNNVSKDLESSSASSLSSSSSSSSLSSSTI
ncbi:hypothetical protein PV326_013429 [Microctonus aethiopoides]|nr:hypothetical protein PV326_013429 [Microctonus aethiopoides]